MFFLLKNLYIKSWPKSLGERRRKERTEIEMIELFVVSSLVFHARSGLKDGEYIYE